MIMTYDFNCAMPGCKAHVFVEMHMHKDTKLDPDQLGKAFGFHRPARDPGADYAVVAGDDWRCAAHPAPYVFTCGHGVTHTIENPPTNYTFSVACGCVATTG